MLVPLRTSFISILFIFLLSGCNEESRLQMKAGMGDPVAMRKLGEALQRAGSHVEFDEGTKWLMKASEKGDLEATYSLGLQYDSPGSDTKALHWYRKGAEMGHRFCMIRLANAYRYGLYNLPKDPVEAKKWFDASEKARKPGEM